ncbi:MAG TPA: hypothetical protein V6C58_15495 [Allocoleopsis sp.]
MVKVHIKSFRDIVNIKAFILDDEYKITKDFLEDVLLYLNETGMLYGELVGKDKIRTLMLDK